MYRDFLTVSPTINPMHYQQCLYPISGVVHINIPFPGSLAPMWSQVELWCDRLPDDFFDHLTIHQTTASPVSQAPKFQTWHYYCRVAQLQKPMLTIAQISKLTGFVLAEPCVSVRNYDHLCDRNLDHLRHHF
jgi:2-succinyl-5-enolpyruvyl-6-hydroxy-3-cyclohexene-1-carboxylate synthase